MIKQCLEYIQAEEFPPLLTPTLIKTSGLIRSEHN
jgi:hypothetical protein